MPARMPYQNLGVEISPDTKTWEAMISRASLEWEVVKEPCFWLNPATDRHERVADRFVIRRTDNNSILSTVGNLFTVLQNRDAGVILNSLTCDNILTYETAGSFKGGRIVWAVANTNKMVRIGGFDVINLYILITYGHDGSRAVNMQPMCIKKLTGISHAFPMQEVIGRYASKHTSGMSGRLEDIQATLGKIIDWFLNKYEPMCQSLISKTCSNERVLQFITDLGFGGASLKSHGIAEDIGRLYATGRGNNTTEVSGTAWALYNAVAEWVDHERSTKVQGGSASAAEARLLSAWLGAGAEIKSRALDLALQI